VKAFIIITAVGLLAYLLVKRMTVPSGSVGLNPADAPYTPGAAGQVGVGIGATVCKGLGALDISGQCKQLASNPVYQGQVAKAWDTAFTKKGASSIGTRAEAEFRSASTLFGALDYLGGSGNKPPPVNAWRDTGIPQATTGTTTPKAPINAWGKL